MKIALGLARKKEPIRSASIAWNFAVYVSLFTLVACNMTGTMDVPLVTSSPSVSITTPQSKQATFALSKVVANIKR